MAGRITPTGWVVKFLVAPLLLAIVGYFVLGPSLVEMQKHAAMSSKD